MVYKCNLSQDCLVRKDMHYPICTLHRMYSDSDIIILLGLHTFQLIASGFIFLLNLFWFKYSRVYLPKNNLHSGVFSFIFKGMLSPKSAVSPPPPLISQMSTSIGLVCLCLTVHSASGLCIQDTASFMPVSVAHML